MAEKRMFAKTIVLSDAFLDMPLSARCLYFTLGMLADDDGFINNPKSVMRQCGASPDDLSVLLGKKFVLAFETGVIVIKHWRINNLLRADRYQPTKYVDERNQLSVEDNGAYTFGIPTIGIPSMGIPRLDKDSIDKVSIDKVTTSNEGDKKFKKPTLEEVQNYCNERHNGINAQSFVDFYESKGWKVGKNAMKDWRACIRTWEQRKNQTDKSFTDIQEKHDDLSELNDTECPF